MFSEHDFIKELTNNLNFSDKVFESKVVGLYKNFTKQREYIFKNYVLENEMPTDTIFCIEKNFKGSSCSIYSWNSSIKHVKYIHYIDSNSSNKKIDYKFISLEDANSIIAKIKQQSIHNKTENIIGITLFYYFTLEANEPKIHLEDVVIW